MNENCGCCEGVEILTPQAIANRPGLAELAYRAGTHATFLETMKARLSSGDLPALARLSTREANDPSIALLDAWSTVADVLTFYQERIANEGYLRTATERRSILELGRLVGYTIRPGVAASVYLAFTLEDGHDTEIPAGTRAQSLPGPGELPQPFETAEKLEARAAWNVLTPRRNRPQPPQQWFTKGRLYLKGTATDLEPNDPLLFDFGPSQSLLRVESVEPDPTSDRTLVTLQAQVTGKKPESSYEELREKLDTFLDLRSHAIPPGVMARHVVGILHELQAALTSGTPPEQLADLLSDTYLPPLQQDFETARSRPGHTRLEPWVGEIVEQFRTMETWLRAGAGQAAPPSRTMAAPNGPSGDLVDSGVTPLSRLEDKLEKLAVPPSVQPANSLRLSRSLDKTFDPASDAIPGLLVAMQPALGRNLYRAWEQDATEREDVQVYALRTTASPFGHNAPLQPILGQNGAILGSREWELKKFDPSVQESFGVDVMITPPTANQPYRIGITVSIGGESKPQGPQNLQNGTFTLPVAGESVQGTISDVSGGSFLLTLYFPGRQMTVEIGEQVVSVPVINIAAGPTSGARISVHVEQSGEVKVASTGVDSADADVGQGQGNARRIRVRGGNYGRAATEQAGVVWLDNVYQQILPGGWIVLQRPYPVGDIPERVIARIEEVREGTRADYGIAPNSTRITLPENKPWIAPAQDDFGVIRGTSIYTSSELLEVAEAPLETTNEGGVVESEPVCGGRIELDALYDGLKSGRWLIITGERTDLPGVRASELVMLAGVEQKVPLGPPVGIAGKGQIDGPSGPELKLSARQLPDGSTTGYAVYANVAGEVLQVVPPSEAKDFWCVNVEFSAPNILGLQEVNFYIRDTGDGVTTFDQIFRSMGEDMDCNRSTDGPMGDSEWATLTDGDFRAFADPSGDSVHSTLVLANDLAYCYRRETVEIYANVANATHGETRTEVLGSGDGSKSLQRFSLKQSPLTYVAAPTPDGAESTLEVLVNDVRWHEARRLAGLGRADRRFITQTDDEDEVTLTFGDGERGARLPTGVENVRAVYRTGIGRAGNAAERQISQLATRPLGLKGVINPLPATGGADREGRDQARRNTPLAVMALDRLVSVRDYADFARTFAGIGKASAARLTDGRRQLVHVTVAGAGDVPIARDSDLYRNLDQALRRFGDPYQPLRVEVRELIVLVLSAWVRVLPDYLWEKVEPGIRAALLDTFGFEQRELGQDALLSEVIGTIQNVPGVAYVDVDTFGGVPEKTADTTAKARRSLLPSEISERILKLTEGEAPPLQRVESGLAVSENGMIRPAQLAFMTPDVPDTLILQEITS